MSIDLAVLNIVRQRGLSRGGHSNPQEGFCVMEAAALLRKAPFRDELPCVSPVIRRFLIRLNDSPRFDRFRNELIDYIDPNSGKPLIFNTANGLALERKRAYVVADWAIRTIVPMAMEAIGKTAEAAELRALPEVVDRSTASIARETAMKVKRAAAADAAAYAYAAADAYAYAAAARMKRAAPTIEPRKLWDESLRALKALIVLKPVQQCVAS